MKMLLHALTRGIRLVNSFCYGNMKAHVEKHNMLGWQLPLTGKDSLG